MGGEPATSTAASGGGPYGHVSGATRPGAGPTGPFGWGALRAPDGAAYRPHLDGLRAVAVYLVVAFHAGSDRLAGGFIGVDAFFVLSGYLVTGVLLRESADGGSVRFGRFYARRVRRLLPAAAANLVVSAVVFRAIASPAELPAAREAMRWASLWVSNWWFVRESADYFGTDVTANPVLHHWSLSVEEQFYVLWPLALALTIWAARRFRRDGRRALVALVVLAGSASLLRASTLAGSDPERAYYGTDARAYQVLAGAALALLAAEPGLRRRFAVSAGRARFALDAAALLSLGGLGLLATSWVEVDPVGRGALAAALTCALVATLERGAGGPVRAVLSHPVVTLLGRVSYGTYLWHWIVVLVVTRELGLGPAATFVVAAVVATVVAVASYVLLERPIRSAPRLDRTPRPVIVCGLAVSLLVGLVVVPQVLRGSEAPREVLAADGATSITVDWRAAQADGPDFNGCDTGGAVLCPITQGSGRRVLLVGDSHAAMLLPAFETVAEAHDLELASVITVFCPWTRGLRFTVFTPDCLEQQATTYDETLAAFDPDLVVLVHRALDDPMDALDVFDGDLGLLRPGPEREPQVELRTGETIAALRFDGREVVIVEPLPIDRGLASGAACLSEARTIEECAFDASPGPLPQETVFRRADALDDGVWSLDLDRSACPALPRCDAVVDGDVVRYDSSHLTATFARTLGDDLDRRFVELGIVDP